MSLSALLLFVVGCDGDGAIEVADAEIENYLPVDGCSWVVRVGDSEYAPDEASLLKIRAFTKDASGTTNAKIHYKLTGNDGKVECELGLRTLPEVVVTEISAP